MTIYQCSETFLERGSVISNDYTFYLVRDNEQMEVNVGIVYLFICLLVSG